jgi:hypothetical protein
MKITSRNPMLSLAALAVYATSLVAGGLHQHGHEAHAADSAVFGQLAWDSVNSNDTCADDADGCTVCAAVQQAKAAPPDVAPLASLVLVGAISPIAKVQLPFTHPIAAQARGPPIS